MAIPGFSKLNTLHEGRQSILYRAERDADQATVVIKTLRSFYPSVESLKAFRREYDLTYLLMADGIPYCLDLHFQDQVAFMVFEDCGGESLAQRLKSGALPILESLTLALQMVEILAHIHQNKVIRTKSSTGTLTPVTGSIALRPKLSS